MGWAGPRGGPERATARRAVRRESQANVARERARNHESSARRLREKKESARTARGGGRAKRAPRDGRGMRQLSFMRDAPGLGGMAGMSGIPRRDFRFKKLPHICLVFRPAMAAHA